MTTAEGWQIGQQSQKNSILIYPIWPHCYLLAGMCDERSRAPVLIVYLLACYVPVTPLLLLTSLFIRPWTNSLYVLTHKKIISWKAMRKKRLFNFNPLAINILIKAFSCIHLASGMSIKCPLFQYGYSIMVKVKCTISHSKVCVVRWMIISKLAIL